MPDTELTVMRVGRNPITHVGVVHDARVETMSWELNRPGTMSYTIPISGYDPADLAPIADELQVWRPGDAEPIWWGLPQRIGRAGETVKVDSIDLLYYPDKAFFGPPLLQYLDNPDFENNITDWTEVDPGGDLTVSVSTTTRARGAKAARLVSVAGFEYLEQQVTIVDAGPPGFLRAVTLSAWYYIESIFSPGAGNRGLQVEVQTPSGTEFFARALTMSSPTGQWVRQEIKDLYFPTGATTDFFVRLPSILGTIVWDATGLRERTFVGRDTAVEDYNTIIGDIIGYASAKNGWEMGYDGAPTGVSDRRLYAEDEHGNIGAALQEYVDRDLADYSIEPDNGGLDRNFTLYHPRRGAFKPLATALDTDLVAYDLPTDGTNVRTGVRVLGRGTGVSREVAYAEDTTGTDGLLLEHVEQAGQNVPLISLDDIADSLLDCMSVPGIEGSITVRASQAARFLPPNVNVGDRLDIIVDYPGVSERYRVLGQTWTPPNGQVTLAVTQSASGGS